ncbi:MAG: hypothetical protein LUD72_01490 [Bacteroidales bacterium]|nr:hypothetical protein [Bacteroidales bacterium]
MGNILDEYKRRLDADNENEDFDLPEDVAMSSDDMEAYREELKKQREKIREYDLSHQQRRANSMTQMTEKELIEMGKLAHVPIKDIRVAKVYCPDCGEELKADGPMMYNPYTGEKIAKHTCRGCGKVYNLEYAYPRLMFVDENGNEARAYGL